MQIFHRSANVASRTSIYVGIFTLAFALWACVALQRSPYVTYAGVARPQPVPFSHEHHVAGLGIDCRYCHTSVETSAFAGIPPTRTCMNCHSQIWTQSPMLERVRESYRTGQSISWVRVHTLAEFVYFDHSIHLKKGVGCATCHGRVDEMPLTTQVASLHMEWCLECHRNPERYVRPREQVFNMGWDPADVGKSQEVLGRELVQAYGIQRLTSCSVCHR